MTKEELRKIIREELNTILKEQAKNWWQKPADAEVDAHLKPSEVHEEMCEGEGCLDEKSVPEPYNRKSPPRRPMTKSQIAKRKRIGKSMENNEKIKSQFMKDYGDDWKSYLWAAATSATFREKGTTKADDKRKK
jgi:hypothetical protein